MRFYNFKKSFTEITNKKDFSLSKVNNTDFEIKDGSILIAAITSCTNTSNPNVLIGAGLLAKKAVELGLEVKPWVKTSLAPGSQVVTDYLKKAGLLEDVKKGHVRITDRGLDVVKNGKTIDLEFLKQYPEFAAQYSKRRSNYDFNGEYSFNTNYKNNTSNDRELNSTEDNFDYNSWEEKDEDGL